MEPNGYMGVLHRSTEWIMRLVYLNLLWIAFSLLGFVLLGFFPATVAMFSVVRKWVMGETTVKVLKVFWQTYRKEFWKANRLGVFLVLGWCILYFDLEVFPTGDQLIYQILSVGLLGTILYFSIFCMYLFPVNAQFELRFFSLLRRTLLISLVSPLRTLLMVTATVCLYFFMLKVPATIFLFSGSIISFIWMWISNQVFIKLEVYKPKQVHSNEAS